MRISIVACAADNNVIGYQHDMPWRLPEDMQRFKYLTIGKPVVMGMNTYATIGRPLGNRQNYVLTSAAGRARKMSGVRNLHTRLEGKELYFVGSLFEVFDEFRNSDKEIMVIGGQSVYEQAIPYVDTMYITEIYNEYQGDTFFPEFNALEWECAARSDDQLVSKEIEFSFTEYKRIKTFSPNQV